jgi:HK97 family phage major capsid protein
MPVAGGDVVVLEFMADGDIAYGYLDLYLLGERRAITLGSSEHFKFIADKTVFKGTARYDGLPVIAEAFGLMNINNVNPTTSVQFAADTANADSE